MGETGLWRTALFISPSVCMLMSLHAFMCVRTRVCVRVFAHASCGAVGAGLFIMPRVSPPCKASVIPAPSSLHGSVTAPRLPRELLQRFPASPQGQRACTGLRRQQRRPQKKKKNKSLLHLCVSANPRDTTCFFSLFFLNPLNSFSVSQRGKIPAACSRVQQHIHKLNEKDETPPSCWCNVIVTRAPTGRAAVTTIYKYKAIAFR